MCLVLYNLCQKNEVVPIAAITFYVNSADKAKLRALAESRGITTTKMCRDIIRDWVQANLKGESEEEED
jgi:hypothetical protein